MTKLRIPIGLALAAAVAACGGDTSSAPSRNAVQTAQGTPDLSVLAEAVSAAGLGDTLSGPGPFTVFAPSNEAFASLLTELGMTKEQLLADKPLLTAVLQYHVVAGKVASTQIPFGHAIQPLGGGFFKIDRVGSQVVITDGRNRTAKVVVPDVVTSNGVVHVIDHVLLPADENVVETAMSLPQFSTLVAAIQAADLGGALSGAGPFTVFAPTNDAFAALLGELGVTEQQLLANKPLLTKVLTYHVIGARVLAADVVPGVQPATLEGETFSIATNPVRITDRRSRTANIVGTDLLASNGVIHVIDKVILPSP